MNPISSTRSQEAAASCNLIALPTAAAEPVVNYRLRHRVPGVVPAFRLTNKRNTRRREARARLQMGVFAQLVQAGAHVRL